MVAFIEPPQDEVVEKILRGHQSAADHRFASVPVGGLWQTSAPRAPPDADGWVQELDSASSDQLQELTYVDMDTFLATSKDRREPVCADAGSRRHLRAVFGLISGKSSKVDHRWTSPRVSSANTRRKS